MEWAFYECLARRVWRGCPPFYRTRRSSSNSPKPAPLPSWVICSKPFQRTRGCFLISWRVLRQCCCKSWSRCLSSSMSPINGEARAPSVVRAHRRAAAVTPLPLDSCHMLRISLASVIRGCRRWMTDHTTIITHRRTMRSSPPSTSHTPIRPRQEEPHHPWDRCQRRKSPSRHRGGRWVFFS